MSSGYDLLKGLKVTFKELFKKSVTDKYPKEFRDKPQRFHGRHVLNKYEDGMEKCIGCELCTETAPDIYTMSDDGVAVAIEGALDASLEELAQQACDECPADAIAVD